MPNKRAKGQKGVLVVMRASFLEKIDAALSQAGYNDRSSFIRDAVYEKLTGLGYPVNLEEKTAPNRAGRGGRPSRKHSQDKPVNKE